MKKKLFISSFCLLVIGGMTWLSLKPTAISASDADTLPDTVERQRPDGTRRHRGDRESHMNNGHMSENRGRHHESGTHCYEAVE